MLFIIITNQILSIRGYYQLINNVYHTPIETIVYYMSTSIVNH